MVCFIVDLLRRVFSPTCCDRFYRRSVAACFVADLLRRVIMSSMVSFFVSFHVDSSDDKV